MAVTQRKVAKNLASVNLDGMSVLVDTSKETKTGGAPWEPINMRSIPPELKKHLDSIQSLHDDEIEQQEKGDKTAAGATKFERLKVQKSLSSLSAPHFKVAEDKVLRVKFTPARFEYYLQDPKKAAQDSLRERTILSSTATKTADGAGNGADEPLSGEVLSPQPESELQRFAARVRGGDVG
jgi:hypothetical protein